MEGRGRSRARKKHRIIVPKRLVAFMMTALMVFTTIGPDLSVAFAASEADVVFELDGADLVQSVEAVSYTHLDVYKRQALDKKSSGRHRDRSHTNRFRDQLRASDCSGWLMGVVGAGKPRCV